MSATGLKVPKIEEIEERPPISSQIPNNPPVKARSSAPAATSVHILVRHTVLKAPPTAVAAASKGLKVPRTENNNNNPPVKPTPSDSAPASIPASVHAPVPMAAPTASSIDNEFRKMKEEFFRVKEELSEGKEELRKTKEAHCQMKEELFQTKEELRQTKQEMAKLTSAFVGKFKELEGSLHKIQSQFTIQTSSLNATPRQDDPTVNQSLPRIPILMDLNPYGPPASFMPQQPMGGSIPTFLPPPFNSQACFDPLPEMNKPPPFFPTPLISQTPSFNPTPVKSNPAVQNQLPNGSCKDAPRVNQNLVQVPIVSNLSPPASSIQQMPMECSSPSISQNTASEPEPVKKRKRENFISYL